MSEPSPEPDLETPPPSAVLAWLQLIRLPNVFTAVADVLLGFAMTQGGFTPGGTLGLLIVVSVCHYWTGMIFNDVFDRSIDAAERPGRPIPSGRIPLKVAASVGLLLNVLGLGVAGWIGLNTLLVAAALTAAIYLYDGALKKTPLGPVAMGSCRFFNVLLGASAAVEGPWQVAPLHVAAGLGVYVAGLTWFAKQEAKWSHRGLLVLAAIVINLGLAILLAFMLNAPTEIDRTTSLLVLAVIALTIVRRLVTAIFEPSPQNVQIAIKVMLLSLVVLDATLVIFTTGHSGLGIATAALIVPAFLLSRWIPMT